VPTATPSPAYQHLVARRRADLREALAQVLSPGRSFTGEIGCGHGHFLTAYAAAHPEELCLGLDLQAERIARAERKCNRAALGNLHFFHAAADDFLEALPAGAAFGKVFILFPDPWPKRRHHKNRLIQPAFLHALAARAGQGSRLYFRTDDRGYFAQAGGIIAAHPAWQLDPGAAWPFETTTVFQARAACHQSLTAVRRDRPGPAISWTAD